MEGHRHFIRGSSSQGWVTQLLVGTDAGTWVRGHVGVWGLSPTVWAGWGGERRDTHTHTQEHTHTGTYTQMLHLPFSEGV